MSTSLWRCEVVLGVRNAYSNQTLFSALMLQLLIPKMALGIVNFFHGNAILSLQHSFHICLGFLLLQHK